MSWSLPFPDSAVTGEFGTRSKFRIANNLGPHRGVDWAPGVNKIIPAVTSGTVKSISWSRILGWVMVQTGWAEGKTWYVGYCHLACAHHGAYCKGPSQHKDGSTYAKSLKVGDKVELGQTVGRIGSTGSASSGPHLHATLSHSVKGVFYGKVYDLKEHIKKHATAVSEPKKVVKEPAKPKALPKSKVDGSLDKNDWARIQTWLKKDWGYTGPIDGLPGKQTYSAMERFANSL